MKDWKRGFRTAGILAPLFVLLLGQTALGQGTPRLAAPDRQALDLMNAAVERTVQETGVEVIEVGSWVRGTGYKGPLNGGSSDHDMRIVMTGEAEGAALSQKWKNFQAKLKENIVTWGEAKRLRADQIQALINKTNVYPPIQLMQTVENITDAKRVFAKAGATPNLGNAPVEGIWGKGSQTYYHYYEKQAGKAVYLDPKTGRVMKGATDLVHLVEGAEALSTAGAINRATQWAEKSLEELENGNLGKAATQAKRLRDEVNAARSLERVGGKIGYLDDIVNGTVTDPDAIRAAIARAQKEAELLSSLAQESNVTARGVLRSVLTNEGGELSKVGKIFWKYAGQVPWGRFLMAWQIYTNYATARDISTMTGADFNAAVLTASSKQLGWLAGLLPGLAMELADATLQAARAGAYGVVTAFQECENLAAGVHSVKGREDLNPGMTIDQMATAFPDTPDTPGEPGGRTRLDNFVRIQARQASFRLENNVWVEDGRVADGLYAKCSAQLVQMWRERRKDRIGTFNSLYLDFERVVTGGRAVIAIQPDGDPVFLKEPAPQGKVARVTIDASTTSDQAKMLDLVRQMNETLADLEGGRKGALVFASTTTSYAFSLDGHSQPERYQPVHYPVVFTEPGEHVASLTVGTSVTAIVRSNDITQYWAMQGYTKEYLTTATLPFAVVTEAAPLVASVSIVGPASVRVGDKTAVAAVVKFPETQPADDLRFRWTDETGGLRLSSTGVFQNLDTSRPASYAIRVDVFVMVDEKEVLVGSARHTLRVDEAAAEATEVPLPNQVPERPPDPVPDHVPEPPKASVPDQRKSESPDKAYYQRLADALVTSNELSVQRRNNDPAYGGKQFKMDYSYRPTAVYKDGVWYIAAAYTLWQKNPDQTQYYSVFTRSGPNGGPDFISISDVDRWVTQDGIKWR
ncbi:MAG: hypothetical protein WCP29_05990 [Acidobacteriota bacterium]